MSDLKEVFNGIQAKFDEGPVGDFSATYLFDLQGDENSKWTLRITDGQGAVEEGDAGDATCNINMSAENFTNMVTGKANAQMLFMQGKLKVSGNMGQALKLQKVLG
jgi:putative sterol carrier protein